MAEKPLIGAEMASKRQHVFAKLDASRKQRNAAVAARLSGSVSGGEAAEQFWAQYNFASKELETAIDKQLTKAGHSIDPVAAERAVTGWTESMAAIRKLVADAALALPTYDAEKAQKNFLALQGTFELARAKLTPRRKFRFSDKARARLRARREAGQGAATAASRSATEEASRRLATESEAAMAALAAEEVLVSGKQGESIIVGGDSGASKGNDMRLADLKDCTVLILSQTRAIRVDGLQNCKVYTGAVAGSVLLHNCQDCAFMLASRQIRLHTSTRCDFYLHVHSRPIIEFCSELRFAPYPVSFPSLPGELEEAGLQPIAAPSVAGMWREVDDFGWHKVQASPNWSVLPAAERAMTASSDLISIDWGPHAEYVAQGGDGAASAADAPAPAPPSEAAAAPPAAAEEEGESDDEL